MKIFEANISNQTLDYLKDNLSQITSFEIANQKLLDDFGIKYFFENEEEFMSLKQVIFESQTIVDEPDRAEYGDFQTNQNLADKVVKYLSAKNISPKIIIEPTCGKGNFIVASLQNFKQIKHIIGVEIYKPYVWETKFNIVDFYLQIHDNQLVNKYKPEIIIAHCSVFDFDFKPIERQYSVEEILIIGNPPWVTSAKLSSLDSKNLPRKTNFKNHNGLDAMTGKGNFDIAEFITLNMIRTFQNKNGHLLFLVKNSVIKNIIFDQKINKYNIASIEKLSIDSKKEFNVSVEASLFFCQLNTNSQFNCTEFDFYNNQIPYQKFGWIDDKFVSNIDSYHQNKQIDGTCQFVWRQGLKHDCSSIMELEKMEGESENNLYINGLHEKAKLEEGLVYGILKSSDLKNSVINQTRKFTIVTQKKVGQDTQYIKFDYPQTYQYLVEHQQIFNARKSSIYNGKPAFSIFGIGNYSFKPYKVAISGLYKSFHFTLILPQNDKPVMLDDTCYFIGFEQVEFAAYALILLNSEKTAQFLQSITFADAKRTFTKDVLMRIDLSELAKNISKQDLQIQLDKLNEMYNFKLSLNLWKEFIEEMTPISSGQMAMFA
jgi:hypothetical protein